MSPSIVNRTYMKLIKNSFKDPTMVYQLLNLDMSSQRMSFVGQDGFVLNSVELYAYFVRNLSYDEVRDISFISGKGMWNHIYPGLKEELGNTKEKKLFKAMLYMAYAFGWGKMELVRYSQRRISSQFDIYRNTTIEQTLLTRELTTSKRLLKELPITMGFLEGAAFLHFNERVRLMVSKVDHKNHIIRVKTRN